MSSGEVSVRQRHRRVEEGTRSTHGVGFDPRKGINPYYGSQFSVDAERSNEADGLGMRLQGPVAMSTSGWVDIAVVTLSGDTWVLLGTAQCSSGIAEWRLWDGVSEFAHAQSAINNTVSLNAYVQPRGGATYRLQGMMNTGSGGAVQQICSLIAIRAFT